MQSNAVKILKELYFALQGTFHNIPDANKTNIPISSISFYPPPKLFYLPPVPVSELPVPGFELPVPILFLNKFKVPCLD